jgi:hypothetical protein
LIRADGSRRACPWGPVQTQGVPHYFSWLTVLRSQFLVTPSIVHNRESEPTFCHHSAIVPEFDVSQLGVFLPQPRLVREGAASIEYATAMPAIDRS